LTASLYLAMLMVFEKKYYYNDLSAFLYFI
jgi:hypothetical protein